MKFNSRDELQRFSPLPRHSGLGKCEVTPTDPDRFLGVPIRANNEVLGVLRTAKTNGDAPFTSNDEMLFSSLATRLSPIIENLVDLERREKLKESQIEKSLAKELKDKIEKIYTEKDIGTIDFVTKRIKSFFAVSPADDEDLDTRILKSISSLWDDSGIIIGKTPLKSFKFFDKEILSELPGYRDHFTHQYQVFLIGYCIIEMLNKLGKPFYESYRQSLSPFISIAEEEKETIANIAWLITSTFHDIAYPLEETKRWLPNMISDFLGEEGKEVTPEVPIEKIFFQSQTYLNFLDELAGFFSKMGFTSRIKEADFRAWLQSEVALNKDHGVLSSLILLRPHFLGKEEIILPAALAIALHKRLGLKVKAQGVEICYDKYPLFFLLLYCDLIQEWNRDPQTDRRITPVLKKIVVTKDIDEIPKAKHHVPREVIENKETIYVYSEIVVDTYAQEKINECKDWFNLICSINPYFIIKINAEFVIPLVSRKQL